MRINRLGGRRLRPSADGCRDLRYAGGPAQHERARTTDIRRRTLPGNRYKVNLFESPYVDKQIDAKIKAAEDIVEEFEYDCDRINREHYKTRNKNSIIYQVRIIAIHNKSGAIVGHMLFAKDVTAAKEAEYRMEENKKNLEMAMEAAHMSLWVYDVDKQTFAPLYGEPLVRHRITLEQLQMLIHPQDRQSVMNLFARLTKKEIRQGRVTVGVLDKGSDLYRHYESLMRLSTG